MMNEEQQLMKKDLQTIEEEILFYKNNIGESVFEIGKRLIEVQNRLTYQTFGEWLREKVNFSRSSAYNFIRIAKEFDLETVQSLGQTKVFELATLDKEDRELFLKDTHLVNGKKKTVKEMSTREFKKVIKEEFKRGEYKPKEEIKHNSYEDFLKQEIELEKEINNLKNKKENITREKLWAAKDLDVKVEFEEVLGENSFNNNDILIFVFRGNEREYVGKIDWCYLWSTNLSEAYIKFKDHIKEVPWGIRNKVTTKEWDKIKVELEKYWEVYQRNREERENEQKRQWEQLKQNSISEESKLQKELLRELVQAGYKKLVLKYHPDTSKKDTTEEFRILTEIKNKLLGAA
ncbi:DUF3102 domain-containing protein [Clostridium perfringens]